MNSIDDYIVQCKKNNEDSEKKFYEFIEFLNKIKDNPELILTDLFSIFNKQDFTVVRFNNNIFKNSLLPLIKTITVFQDTNLISNDCDSFYVYDKTYQLFHINIDKKNFDVLRKKPKWSDYDYRINKQIVEDYAFTNTLLVFYNNKSFDTWHNFTKLVNPKKTFKGFIYGLTYFKDTTSNRDMIKRSEQRYKDALDWKEQDKKEYEEKMIVWNNNHDKIELIKEYLLRLGYIQE